MVSLRRLRAFGLLWAVLQFALPAAVSFADALTAVAAGHRAATHIEDSPSKDCRPVHTEGCALCRFLSNAGATIARAEVTVPSRGAPAAVVQPVRVVCTASARRLPASRAPPIV